MTQLVVVKDDIFRISIDQIVNSVLRRLQVYDMYEF